MDVFVFLVALTDGGHGGTYAFVGPGWHGTIAKGVVRIDVPTPDAWLLGRTQVKGPADLLAAVELEAPGEGDARDPGPDPSRLLQRQPRPVRDDHYCAGWNPQLRDPVPSPGPSAPRIRRLLVDHAL